MGENVSPNPEEQQPQRNQGPIREGYDLIPDRYVVYSEDNCNQTNYMCRHVILKDSLTGIIVAAGLPNILDHLWMLAKLANIGNRVLFRDTTMNLSPEAQEQANKEAQHVLGDINEIIAKAMEADNAPNPD